MDLVRWHEQGVGQRVEVYLSSRDVASLARTPADPPLQDSDWQAMLPRATHFRLEGVTSSGDPSSSS